MGIFSKMDLENSIDNDRESPARKFRTRIATQTKEQKAEKQKEYDKYASTYNKKVRRSMDPKSSRDRED